MLRLANVHVIIIGGNHDDSRSFFLGEVLSAWYRLCDQFYIDNSPSPRKYQLYGNTLLGFMHQFKKSDIKGLPYQLAREAKKMFAHSKYREIHVGHTHAEKIQEIQDCKIITLPSLAPESDWSSKNGYSHLQEAQAQVYSLDRGKLATYSCPANQFLIDNN